MAAPIGPGDWVRYVREAPRYEDTDSTLGTQLIRGEVYRVHQVVGGWAFSDGIGAIELEGCSFVMPDGDRECWDIRCFDPVGGEAFDVVAALKAPPKSAPRQPALPTRTPEIVGAGSRDEHGSLGFAVSVAALRMLEGG